MKPRRSSVSNESNSAPSAKSIVASTERSMWMFRIRLVDSTAYCGSAATRRAHASAASNTSSGAHTWLVSPSWCARSAEMRSPVNANSLAISMLVCSGHVIGPPSAATRPTTTCGSARWAFSDMYTTSDKRDEAAPETDGGAVHGGDDRHPALQHVEHESLAGVDADAAQRPVVGQLAEVVEVAAGGERPPVARQHHGAGLGVEADLREEAGEPLVQFVVDGVEIVGPVEADDPDRAVGLDHDLVGHVVHGGSPR